MFQLRFFSTCGKIAETFVNGGEKSTYIKLRAEINNSTFMLRHAGLA